MKRKIGTALAVIAIGLCLASCAKKEAQEGNCYVSPVNGGYTIQVPKEWEVKYTDGMIGVSVPDDISGANICAYVFPHGLETQPDSASYWEIYSAQLNETFSQTVVDDSKTKNTKLAGMDAVHKFYTVKIGEETFACQIILGVYGENVYTLTLTQGAKTEEHGDSYVDYSEKFEEIAGSFSIGN